MLTAQERVGIRRIQKEANAFINGLGTKLEVDRAKADTKWLFFPKGAHYRFYCVKMGKKRKVKGITFAPQIRFCHSVHPNHAGFWVAWVDTIQANGKVKSSGWTFNRSKRIIMDHNWEKYERARAKVKARGEANQT